MAGQIVLNSFLVLGGLVLLYFGGHFLVSGSVAMASRLRMSPLVIGLTVVAFGTSAPELFVSLVSALSGQTAVSMGNVIGSNIVNIALILGLAAVFRPLRATSSIIRFDMAVMVLAYAVLLVSSLDFGSAEVFAGGVIGRIEGVIMVVLLVTYMIILYRRAKLGRADVLPEIPAELRPEVGLEASGTPRAVSNAGPAPSLESWTLIVLKIAGGITGLAIGARILVDGASWIAGNVFGASERFIGLTVVAIGTSLPELITSVAAAVKGEMDISLGNIVGSNIFNSFIVLGLVSIIRPLDLGDSNFVADFLVMIGITLVLWLVLASAKRLPRWVGIVFVVGYIAYTVFLIQTRGA